MSRSATACSSPPCPASPTLPSGPGPMRMARGLVVSEMVASGELAKGARCRGSASAIPACPSTWSSLPDARPNTWPRPRVSRLARAPTSSTLNMGCPAKKVTGGYAGAALMRDLPHALSLIEAVVEAAGVPVTVKMRLGWDDEARNAPALARAAENVGVRMITIHGRTRCQFYQGRAGLARNIRGQAVGKNPVVANGDVCGRMMRGRFSYSPAPTPSWWAVPVMARPGRRRHRSGRLRCPRPRRSRNRRSARGVCGRPLRGHARPLRRRKGGLRQARKHLGWYLDAHAPDAAAELRASVMSGNDPRGVVAALRTAFAETSASPVTRSAPA